MDYTIIMISAGMDKPKKDFNPLNEKNLYLNYGLLGLGTQLSDIGYKVKVFQGDYKRVKDIFHEINLCNIEIHNLKYPIFISIPSFFALSWAKKIIDSIKLININAKVIVGGRWVVDNNIEWLKTKIKNVDLFVKGYGEKYIEKCLDENKWVNIDEKLDQQGINVFSKFDYTILFNYKMYHPCIEVSRGCGRGCKFCVENKTNPVATKEPKQIIKEAKDIIKVYGCNTLNFYFQASIFNPTQEWANEFHKIYQENDMNFNWRFETRVDSLNKSVLHILSKAGLKVIDLGLESACEDQLLNMGKTKNVKMYLEKAKDILEEAYKNNIWTKLNILLYPGEISETIDETSKWLNHNKKYIKGVSVNPLILYRNGDFTYDFIKHIETLSKIKIDTNRLEENGYMFIDLSREIDSELSKKLSLSISRDFMNIKDYYDLKSICYYPRDAKFKDLVKILEKSKYSNEELPFNLVEDGAEC